MILSFNGIFCNLSPSLFSSEESEYPDRDTQKKKYVTKDKIKLCSYFMENIIYDFC